MPRDIKPPGGFDVDDNAPESTGTVGEKSAYTPRQFRVAGSKEKPFPLNSPKAIELLESIMPDEKAQAVPYVMIWEIDAKTGEPKHGKNGIPNRPLTMSTIEPPLFGVSVKDTKDVRFRERPPVSLERVAVKTQNPRGMILYRTLELSFVVHRPDIIFEEHVNQDGSHKGEADSWSSLITPGEVFALEYGWSASSAVKNGILNGLGHSDNNTFIQGRERLRFVVTNYTFKMTPDNQVRFLISAYELGEFNLREAFLVDGAPDNSAQEGKGPKTKKEVDPYADDSAALKKLLKKVQDQVSEGAQKKANKSNLMVPFGLLFDEIFAPPIQKAYKDWGFDLKGIVIGRLNDRAGIPAPKYSSDSVGGTPISDFKFPLSDIEKIFQDLIKGGTRMTVYNFIEPFLRLFENPSVWDRKGVTSPEKFTIPQVNMRVLTNKNKQGKIEVEYHIFDANTEFTKFTNSDWEKGNEDISRSEIRKKVNKKNVPFISLVRANSYIKDASFEVIQDEQMKGIFMRRYFGEKHVTREATTQQTSLSQKENRAVPAQQIFAPTIKGKITMIGNFVVGTFALVWLDFGIRRWDGPFTAFEREDVIERGSFTTTMSLQASGTDPLGTQGRQHPPDATTPSTLERFRGADKA